MVKKNKLCHLVLNAVLILWNLDWEIRDICYVLCLDQKRKEIVMDKIKKTKKQIITFIRFDVPNGYEYSPCKHITFHDVKISDFIIDNPEYIDNIFLRCNVCNIEILLKECVN